MRISKNKTFSIEWFQKSLNRRFSYWGIRVFRVYTIYRVLGVSGNDMKKRFKKRCVCGREITGFSEHHVQINLEIHQQTSQFHKEVVKLLRAYGKEI